MEDPDHHLADSVSPPARAIVRHADDVEPVRAFGSQLQFLLRGRDSGGSLAVAMNVTPPGGGPPLHRHSAEDELFLIVEGSMEFLVEGTWRAVGAGGLVYYPRGVAHAFRNVGAGSSRHWVVVTPSGFEAFMEQCAPLFAVPGPPDQERLQATALRHGITVLGPRPQ